tara:strand:- start:1188 stop:1454 length:267 start_codon:yes stop_codon:yes gene_type:complete
LKQVERQQELLHWGRVTTTVQNFPKSSFDDDRKIPYLLNKWTNCFHRADINYWKIFNQGHEWDGLNDFDTSQTIWNFIRNFDLNGAKN